mmetsp:Transcript_136153/g.236670  ORF Transcript_136153/g.236670 Transcript_136153/m.236670 type:complete len:218 (+) Transcript_136153:918-1571(+)
MICWSACICRRECCLCAQIQFYFTGIVGDLCNFFKLRIIELLCQRVEAILPIVLLNALKTRKLRVALRLLIMVKDVAIGHDVEVLDHVTWKLTRHSVPFCCSRASLWMVPVVDIKGQIGNDVVVNLGVGEGAFTVSSPLSMTRPGWIFPWREVLQVRVVSNDVMGLLSQYLNVSSTVQVGDARGLFLEPLLGFRPIIAIALEQRVKSPLLHLHRSSF